MLRGQAKECERDADVIVQIPLGVEQAIALGEDGGSQFLGRRLAVGPCDSDHGDAKRSAVMSS